MGGVDADAGAAADAGEVVGTEAAAGAAAGLLLGRPRFLLYSPACFLAFLFLVLLDVGLDVEHDAGAVGDPDALLADSVDAPEGGLVGDEPPLGRLGVGGPGEDFFRPIRLVRVAVGRSTAAGFGVPVADCEVVAGCDAVGAVAVLGTIDVSPVDGTDSPPGAPGAPGPVTAALACRAIVHLSVGVRESHTALALASAIGHWSM